MKKLLTLILCLSLLAGCASLPVFSRREQAVSAVTEAPRSAAATPVTAVVSEPPSTAAEPLPEVTAAPDPLTAEAPASTPLPVQTYSGACFRFDVPGAWLRADIADGACFFPDPNDTRHTALFYQEAANELKLTEGSLDLVLLLSPRKVVTAMVEKALTGSGFTDFSLSPVDIAKTALNGVTGYKGASDITVGGETYDFSGYIFLRGDRMVLLIWVGDEARYADDLKAVYDSFQEN